ncbi:MAG TPA: hypothetical protein VM582_03200, partial [Candidatus Thermoplasmatota archaeon]|nr:hypothetical protein [Candidatus Thermoplasmatota archaeon]
AALLALAAGILLASATVRPSAALDEGALMAFLAGSTLVIAGIAYWYLPSFAKRQVLASRATSYVLPLLLPLAPLLHLLGQRALARLAGELALAFFAVSLLASALAGRPWRRGIPFWREGPRRRDDRAAALVLALSLLALLATAAFSAIVPSAPRALALGWSASLLLFVLGALAHLLPRARARPTWAPLVVLGAAAGAAGVAALVALPSSWARLGGGLTLGFALAALAVAPPGGAKRPGPRLREAGPPLLAGAAALGTALVAANLGAPEVAAHVALLCALGLGLAGLTLLTLPVLFNQRPSRRHVPLLLLFGASAALLAGVGLAVGTRAGLVLPALALLAWLRVLWPLRKPRRECAPDDAEAS